MDDISVLVCDDSALMRNLIGRIVDETTGLKVCGKAENGQDLLDKIPQCNPDVILLDIEMPVMNGVEFLKKRKLGASDFITKPGGSSVTLKIADVSSEIIEYIASYGGAYASAHGKEIPEADFFTQQVKLREAQRQVVLKKGEEAAKNFTIQKTDLPASSLWNKPKLKEPVTITPARSGGKIELIAIGISTGGPNALRDVFKMIDPRLKQPVMVVQHMPAGFTKEFAASLNNICPLTVTEGVDGEKIEGGHVYIAPGGYHMFVEHRADGNYVKLSQDEQRNGHRPSADVLFESVAKIYQNNALGVIMTGMGRDGAAELAEMRKQGAYTLGQDQASSIVYGMPKVAFELGGVQKQVPLMQMADEISKLAREHC